MSTQFLLFLLLFTLVGLYPGKGKIGPKIAQLFRGVKQWSKFNSGWSKTVDRTRRPALQQLSGQLDSYETLVFRCLAQGPRKGLSRRQLGADLHLQPVHLDQSLQSLYRRGLIQVVVTHLLIQRFSLSERGRSFAFEKDMIPRLLKP